MWVMAEARSIVDEVDTRPAGSELDVLPLLVLWLWL
jgi:hypothetical protein